MGFLDRMTAWMDAMPHNMLIDIAPQSQCKKLSLDPNVDPHLREYALSLAMYRKLEKTAGFVPIQWAATSVHFVALENIKQHIPTVFPQLQEVFAADNAQACPSTAAYELCEKSQEASPARRTITIEFLPKRLHRRRLQQLVELPSA